MGILMIWSFILRKHENMPIPRWKWEETALGKSGITPPEEIFTTGTRGLMAAESLIELKSSTSGGGADTPIQPQPSPFKPPDLLDVAIDVGGMIFPPLGLYDALTENKTGEGSFVDIVGDVGGDVVDIVGDVGGDVLDVAGDVVDVVGDAGQTILDVVGGAGEFASDIFGGIGEFASSTFSGIGEFTTGVFSGIGEFATGVTAGIGEAAGGVGDFFGDIKSMLPIAIIGILAILVVPKLIKGK